MYDTLTGPANAEEKKFFFREKRKHIVPTFIMFITLPTRVSYVEKLNLTLTNPQLYND